MRVQKISFNSNPNVGLYGFVTDEFVLLGHEVPGNLVKKLKTIFKVPVHQMNIAGTSLLGVFIAGNSSCILVPSIAFDYELAYLDKLKINYKVMKTHLTCLGNNILANDNGALVNPEFTDAELSFIKTTLKVPVKRFTLAEIETPGAAVVLNGDVGVVHRDVSPKEKDELENFLNVKLEETTVNMGSPYVRSGILCNKHGLIMGDVSGGPELVCISNALGFSEDQED
jgi:translation initiation factor 6